MIVERVYHQRCLAFTGVDEIAIVRRHRRRDVDKKPRAIPKRPRPRVAKSIGEGRQRRFWWEDIDLEEHDDAFEKSATRAKRSLHPGKLTMAERSSFQPLPRGWDADRPRVRGDCLGDKLCPWCGKAVAMRISYATAPATISCPECKGFVSYQRPRAGRAWEWGRFSLRRPLLGDPDRLPMSARNKCRPCWMTRCSLHLYIEVKDCGSIKLNFPHVPPDRLDLLSDTCAQDVADRVDGDGVDDSKLLPLEVVGEKLGLTLERARQLVGQALQDGRVKINRDNGGEV